VEATIPVESAPETAMPETAAPKDPAPETPVPDAVPVEIPAPAKPFRYEVGVYGTAGLSMLYGEITAGSMRPTGISAGVGTDFSWYFARHWGVGAGVEAAFPSVRLSSSSIELTPGATSSLYKHDTRIDASFLRVPLWLRFRAPVERHWFQAGAGASLDFALDGRYRTETAIRTGNSTETIMTSGSLSFGHGASLIAEAGMCWTLAPRWGVYTGAYAAYGLSDVCPAGNDILRDVTRMNMLLAGVRVKIVISD
jgi:hypothetical protein